MFLDYTAKIIIFFNPMQTKAFFFNDINTKRHIINVPILKNDNRGRPWVAVPIVVVNQDSVGNQMSFL